jgi:hypothetical protein
MHILHSHDEHQSFNSNAAVIRLRKWYKFFKFLLRYWGFLIHMKLPLINVKPVAFCRTNFASLQLDSCDGCFCRLKPVSRALKTKQCWGQSDLSTDPRTVWASHTPGEIGSSPCTQFKCSYFGASKIMQISEVSCQMAVILDSNETSSPLTYVEPGAQFASCSPISNAHDARKMSW